MNYGLYQMWKEKIFTKYKAFFLITNDTVIEDKEPWKNYIQFY